MSDREVMRQSLEALEWVEPSGTTGHGGIEARKQAITALRAALAESEPEPVANGWTLREVLFEDGEPIAHREPPARRPLTDEDIQAEWRVACDKNRRGTTGELVRAFARGVERKITGDDDE